MVGDRCRERDMPPPSDQGLRQGPIRVRVLLVRTPVSERDEYVENLPTRELRLGSLQLSDEARRSE